MSAETVSALERGARRVPHRETLTLLRDALRLAPDDEAELEAAVGRAPRSRGVTHVGIPSHNLPSQLSSLVGRDVVVAEVAELADAHRLVTLVGTGGIGKTRVALQVAENLCDAWPGGVWLADLALLDDPALVAGTIVNALGVHEPRERSAPEALVGSLGQRRFLLLLDNCEHLIEEVARIAEVILRASPRAHILATSRERLNVAGEWVYRMPALTVPPPGKPMSAEEALAFGSVALFVERAKAGGEGFSFSNENAPIVADLCRRLDGIPLAIELAAARSRVMAPLQLARQLGERLRLLTGGSRTAPPRQQTMREAMDWSYELLSEPERVLFRRVGIFTGVWTLDAAETVCSDPRLPVTGVFDALSSLVEKSLVSAEFASDETWYRLLETARAYALDKLGTSGDEATVSRRHAEWVAAFQ